MSDGTLPEADRAGTAPHPRRTERIFGQDAALRLAAAALESGRMHHGWLLTGPRGTGKATLAWAMARALLAERPAAGSAALFGEPAQPPGAPRALPDPAAGKTGDAGIRGRAPAADHPGDPTAVGDTGGHPAAGNAGDRQDAGNTDGHPAAGGDPSAPFRLGPEDPLARRIAALSEPRLLLIRRPWDEKLGRFKAEIPVEEVRRLRGFFSLTTGDGGRRVVIVDAADDLNPAAANAILKALEEPPAGAVLLLVSHQPSRLLPTIRSRCRELRLAPLGAADLARALEQAGVAPEEPERLAVLSAGSVGDAIRMAEGDGLPLYADLVRLFAAPRLDRAEAVTLAERLAARGQETRFELFVTLADLFLGRLARAGALGPPGAEAAPGEAALLARLSPDAPAARLWADRQLELGARVRAGRAVNLDAAALALDLLLRIEETRAALPRGAGISSG